MDPLRRSLLGGFATMAVMPLARKGMAQPSEPLKVGSLKSEVIVLPSKLIITSL